MIERKRNSIVLPMLYLLLLVLFGLLTYLMSKSLQLAQEKVEDNYLYVSYEILLDNSVPVISTNDDLIIRPYREDSVTIGKNFYDYTKEDSQKNSIIYFENTYIQNSGVDYVAENPFDVISIFDGEVISITEDDIVGISVKIRHSNNIISTYQSLSEVIIRENDKVAKGQIIGKSGSNAIGSELGNHLHFELFYNDELVNPEEYYDKKVGEF